MEGQPGGNRPEGGEPRGTKRREAESDHTSTQKGKPCSTRRWRVPTGRIVVVLAKEAQRTRRSPRAGGAHEPDVVVYIHQDGADPEQRRVAPADKRGRRGQRYGADSNVLVRQHEHPAGQE